MPISPTLVGRRFGVYDVHSLLGVGGMGEVYRARDTKLERDVAIKILPSEVADDPDRLARFEREARVLASLNHPHVGAIYGFEDASTSDGVRVRALVLELVDGETLAERLTHGALGAPEAVAMARQIALALDAAHQRGIVHRDLKPANVKQTTTGAIKVLDFGLAKMATPDLESRDATITTIEMGRTREGVVVGTIPYMSPEQVRGQPVDKRTDIWAFGCVLYEMLSGRRAFAGATLSDTIAAILQHEPDWSALPPQMPAGARVLMKRCLERDLQRRLRDLGDADLALDLPVSVNAPVTYPRSKLWAAVATAALVVVVAAIVAFSGTRKTVSAPAVPLRFQIPAPVSLTASGTFSLSPDGRHLVFGGADAKGVFRLWLRGLDSLETTGLPGTEGEEVNFMPPVVWSPDGRTLAFYSAGKFKRIERSGGLPRSLCDVPGVGVGGSWNASDVILIGNTSGGVVRCAAGGGAATAVTALNPSRKDAAHLVPAFLPDNRHFLYLRASRIDPSESGLYLGDLEAPADRQSAERLVATPFGGTYVANPAGKGHVLFVRDATLMALPFDAERRVAVGEPVIVATGVGSFRDSAFFFASGNTLVYRENDPAFQLTWFDRHGAVTGLVGEPVEFGGAALSPDATHVVMWRQNRLGRSSRELWLVDVLRNTSTPFPTDPEADMPAWSADGKDIYFALGTRGGSVNRRPADASRPSETLLRGGGSDGPTYMGGTAISATPDGQYLVFTAETLATGVDLWLQPLGGGAKAFPLLQQDFDQIDGRVSPDGRWLAYVSNESGTNEVFLRPLIKDSPAAAPVAGSRLRVSTGGGVSPRFRKDGRELFYQSREGAMMAVAVDGTSVGAPAELFRAPGIQTDWSVSADGQRFLVAAPSGRTPPAFTVVVNWQSTLKR